MDVDAIFLRAVDTNALQSIPSVIPIGRGGFYLLSGFNVFDGISFTFPWYEN